MIKKSITVTDRDVIPAAIKYQGDDARRLYPRSRRSLHAA